MKIGAPSELSKARAAERMEVDEPRSRASDYGALLRPGERAPAPYSASGAASRGRLHSEPECPTRSPLQRDRDRILHSTAFRRLTYKTQVFVFHEGDHYRTRLTHSLEVAQIARTIARQLRLDEDLAEALALAHDLGHPPFGHAGERALDAVARDIGGFDHNVQSFRVVTRLERKYPNFDGLNLAWETLEGLAKHNGPPKLGNGPGDAALLHALRHWPVPMDLMLDRSASGEAQAATLADEVAWMTHDIEDGLRAGLIALADLAKVPLIAPILEDLTRFPAVDDDDVRRVYGITRRLITVLIRDTVTASRVRLRQLAPSHPDDIRRVPRPTVAFSDSMTVDLAALRAFLFARLYRHARVIRVMTEAEQVVRDLAERYSRVPEALPEAWRAVANELQSRARSRLIIDFVAGMTDRFALAEHRRLFYATPELR
jgi:dGTPase